MSPTVLLKMKYSLFFAALMSLLLVACATTPANPYIRIPCGKSPDFLENPERFEYLEIAKAEEWLMNKIKFGPDSGVGKNVRNGFNSRGKADVVSIQMGSGLTTDNTAYKLYLGKDYMLIETIDSLAENSEKKSSVSVSRTNCD